MNYVVFIDNIILKLKNDGALLEAEKIEKLKGAASTGGELLSSVTHELLILIKNDSHSFELIGNEVKDLKIYCQTMGMNIW